MLLTFIIPHYNLQKCLLKRCIESIITQGIDNNEYEMIIIDDGSDESPKWIIKDYFQYNIHLIESLHKGLGAARNTGIDHANGEYIQFIDSDDCLVKNSFVPCIDIIKKEHPDILQHKYKICLSEKDIQQESGKMKRNVIFDSGAEYMTKHNLCGSSCNYIFKKEIVYKHHIFFQTGVLHEDEDFSTKIYFYSKKLICCDKTIYNYCIRNGSITSNKNEEHEKKRIEDLFLLLERIISFRSETEKECSFVQKTAIDRKISMLTVDTILNLFYHGDSASYISRICEERLRNLGIYPLPKKNYSLKYRIFRLLANSRSGMKILRKILPSKKPQKK